jgi:hypothetical protein
MSESFTPQLAMIQTFTETITTNDGVTVTAILANTISEAIALADAMGATQIMLNAVGETMTMNATFSETVISSGGAVWPSPSQVALGIVYGPTGTEYTGTLVGSSGAGMMRRR